MPLILALQLLEIQLHPRLAKLLRILETSRRAASGGVKCRVFGGGLILDLLSSSLVIRVGHKRR